MNSMERRIHAVAEMSRGKSQGEIQRASDYLHGVADKALSDRIETFGALRRAAEVARSHDRKADEMFSRGHLSAGVASTCAGENVRSAIRAALKGDA